MAELEILALDEATPQIIVPQTGDTYLLPYDTKTTTGVFNSGVADGATADAFVLNSSNAFSTAGSKLLSITNNGTEQAYLEYVSTTEYKFVVDSPGRTDRGIWLRTGTSRAYLGSTVGLVIESSCEFNKTKGSSTSSVGFGTNGIKVGRAVTTDFDIEFETNLSDVAILDLSLIGQTAYASASTNLVGGNINITGGDGASGSAGLANGGNVVINGGTGYGTGANGKVTTTSTIESDLTTIDQPFINFKATADADTTSAISTNTTSGATTHHVQVEINGTKAWIAVSTNAPS